MVDDAGDPSDDSPTINSEPILGLTEFEGRILVATQTIEFVAPWRRDPVLVIPVQVVLKCDKSSKVSDAGGFDEGRIHGR
jgi:hypothetical protein